MKPVGLLHQTYKVLASIDEVVQASDQLRMSIRVERLLREGSAPGLGGLIFELETYYTVDCVILGLNTDRFETDPPWWVYHSDCECYDEDDADIDRDSAWLQSDMDFGGQTSRLKQLRRQYSYERVEAEAERRHQLLEEINLTLGIDADTAYQLGISYIIYPDT